MDEKGLSSSESSQATNPSEASLPIQAQSPVAAQNLVPNQTPPTPQTNTPPSNSANPKPGSDEHIAQKVSAIRTKFSRDKFSLYFLTIFIFSIAIRIYYFGMAKSQPLWWDEADYLAYAKDLAGIPTHWIVTPQHNSLFSPIVSFFFRFGASEELTRFMVEVLPAIISIYLVYKICILAYEDKRIALIVTFLYSVFWEMLFNNMRFHVEALGIMFGLLAIVVYLQGYEKKQKIFGYLPYQWAIPLAVIFVVLAYASRRGYFLFGLFFLFQMLLTKNWKELFKDKYNWIALAILIGLLFVTETLIFTAPINQVAGKYYTQGAPFTLLPFQVFAEYFRNLSNPFLSPLLYLFWFGIILLLFHLITSWGLFKDPQNKNARSDLFMLLTILITLGYFLIYQRRIDNFGESRWYYPLLLGACVSIAKSSLAISDYLDKMQKFAGIIIILLVIGYGGYYQLQHADAIIKNKLTSYSGIKEAGVYVKQVSSPEDKIISVPVPQAAYYAEREVINPYSLFDSEGLDQRSRGESLDEVLGKIRKDKQIRYLFVSFSEPNHPDWMRKENEEYAQNPQTGQVQLARWEIPFMDTKIDFINNKQDVKQVKSYDGLTFRLLKVAQEVFIYQIDHQPSNSTATA